MSEFTEVVLFSGGLDSTYLALEVLKKSKPNSVILYHINFKNRWNRVVQETTASRAIVEEFKKQFKFKYIESSLDIGNLSPRDSTVWMQMASIVAKSYPIKRVYIGFMGDDSLTSYNYQSILSAPFDDNPPELLMPILHISKAEIIQELIKLNLKDLCFWCRTPINQEACGSCKTCILYNKSLQQIQESSLNIL